MFSDSDGQDHDTLEPLYVLVCSASGWVRGDVLLPLNVTLVLGAQCRTAHASRVLWSFNQSSALRSFLLYPHLLIPHLFDYSITYLYEYGLMDICFFFGLKWDFNLHALHGAPI